MDLLQTIRRAAGHGFASSRLAGRPAGLFALLVAAVVIAGIGPGAASVAHAKVFASQKQALEEAFPKATRIDRKTFLLRAEQVERIEALSGRAVEAKVVVLHVAYRGDAVLGFAEIAVHVVRTQPEAMLIVLSPEGNVRSVRVIAFHEPLDYLPTQGWYAQFVGKTDGRFPAARPRDPRRRRCDALGARCGRRRSSHARLLGGPAPTR